ncbi:MAG: multifunctional CCA addition/repair protein [Gammaproteobacteria bacterium]
MSSDPVLGLEVHLVGGAVRDARLGRCVSERDWVVVGATPRDMLARGFRPVGKDFPVFLHPDSGEEYALARTERKSGHGYHGFVVHAEPDVTLEQDLSRRDLTINAMAESAEGQLTDPFGGQRDLEDRLLRHVSPAFAEDPVRILRVCRFAARYAPLGFRIADETLALMTAMTESGEVDHLVPERVWQETVKALGEDEPQVFFEQLRACGALARLFPEVEALFGVPQPEQWHPEIDTGVHTLLALRQSARLSPDPVVRFATLVHDLGKALTPRAEWPSHRGHEAAGVPLVDALCERLRSPREFRDLGRLVARYHLHVHRYAELRASTIVEVLSAADAWRRPQRVEQFLLACEADARGRTGLEDEPYPQAEGYRTALAAARSVDSSAPTRAGLKGPAIGEAIKRERIRAVQGTRSAA